MHGGDLQAWNVKCGILARLGLSLYTYEYLIKMEVYAWKIATS